MWDNVDVLRLCPRRKNNPPIDTGSVGTTVLVEDRKLGSFRRIASCRVCISNGKTISRSRSVRHDGRPPDRIGVHRA